MYKTLKEICDLTGMKLFITEDENKGYKFAISDKNIDFEYIFIPALKNEKNLFKEIEKHLQNKLCKGFIINEKFLYDKEYIKILDKYSPKNVLCTKNVYLSAFKIAKINANHFNPEIIILAGTDEIEEIKYKLSKNLNVDYIKYNTFWQMSIDPLLRLDENDKYAIIQTNINVPRCSKYIADYKEGSIILYSKISIRNMQNYETIENYNEEWCNLLSNGPRAVFSDENCDLIRLPYLNNLQITPEPLKCLIEYLNKKYIEIVIPPENKDYVFLDSNSLYSIKKGIKDFLNRYKENKKIVFFQKIRNLGKYIKNYNLELLLLLDESFDFIVLSDFEDYLPYIKDKNKKSIIVNFKIAKDDTINSIKKVIEYKKDNDTKCLFIGKNEILCSLI